MCAEIATAGSGNAQSVICRLHRGDASNTMLSLLHRPSADILEQIMRSADVRTGFPRKALAGPIAILVLVIAAISAARAADEPDLIFRRSTVFKWLSPNDKLATYGLDDPEVDGVACHFTVPEKGGFKGWIGVAEEVEFFGEPSISRSE